MTTNSTPPKVSVLMPVYNAAPYLAEAIDSVLHQDFGDFEFLIFDDGSTDRSREILADYMGHDERIQVFHRAHGGLTKLLNEGIQLARGEFIARMDADDISTPDRFQLQADYLNKHPRCAAVGGQVLLIDADGDPIGPLTTQLAHGEIEAELLGGRGAALVHAGAMFRRSTLLVIDGYRPEFNGGEDLDLYLRIAERAELANVPNLVLKVRRHATSVTSLVSNEAEVRRREIVRQAFERRGKQSADRPLRRRTQAGSIEDLYFTWLSIALNSHNFRTAMKYTTRFIRSQPLRARTWRRLLGAYGSFALRQLHLTSVRTDGSPRSGTLPTEI